MKIIKIITLSMVLAILSACTATKKMWQDPRYVETVDSFLMTNDGKKFIVVGKKYHYIFSVSSELKNILLSDKRKLLRPVFHSFSVDDNNAITGKFKLNYFARGDKNEKWLDTLGFSKKKHRYGNNSVYSFNGELSGTRYIAAERLNIKNQFKQPYKVYIKEQPTVLGNLGKALVTPLTATYDGVVTIGVATLFTVVFAIGMANGGMR